MLAHPADGIFLLRKGSAVALEQHQAGYGVPAGNVAQELRLIEKTITETVY